MLKLRWNIEQFMNSLDGLNELWRLLCEVLEG